MKKPMIQCSSKALIIRGNEILLNCCAFDDGTLYYDLPGGGQEPFESIEDALRREIMEETGWRVHIERFAALAEEIYDDPALREQYPEYCHRIQHIFIATAVEQTSKPSDQDFQMLGSRWFAIDEADELPVLPKSLRGRIREALTAPAPLYLSTIHTHAN